MNKQQLISKLEDLKKWILEFQKNKMTIINIPPSKIKKNKKYEWLNLENNSKLKNAVNHMEYQEASKKRKEKIYGIDKTKLKKIYGELKSYLQIFWENPWVNNFSCYDAYFLNDNWTGEDNNFTSIVSDIDIMVGKIWVLTEKEFHKVLSKNSTNLWKAWHPVWWIIVFGKLLWKYKIYSLIFTFILFVVGIFVSKSIDPLVDFITKPLQTYFSWAVEKYLNK